MKLNKINLYMENLFYYSITISIIYFLIKLLELKYSDNKEEKPLKVVLKDSFIVFLSSVVGIYILSQFMLKEISKKIEKNVFVNNPDF
tara:strand:+ start:394 stop:657 length:264 start_codon:yes stop_codon:yes gene_type:complete